MAGTSAIRTSWSVERTHEGSSWTCMWPVRGLMMRPFLKKLFYAINFTPFI